MSVCVFVCVLAMCVGKTFWRCSVCRRRNQGATTPMLTSTGAAGTGVTRQQPISAMAHRWSEEKPGSLSITPDDYNKRSSAQTPGSAPVHRRERRSTSGESGISCSGQDQSRHSAAVQPSLQVESSRHSYGKSIEMSGIDNTHILNGRRSRDGSLTPTPGRTTNRLDQPHETGRSVSASESSPEDMSEQQKMQQYERDSGAGSSISRRSANDIHFGDSSSSRRSSSRRSFQKQMRDQSVYLSADDACLSRWSQQRRYSSESSDASDTSGASGTPRRPSQEESDEVGGGYGSSLLPSTRRRLSFRSNRTRHFYDADGSEGYDGDELSGKLVSLKLSWNLVSPKWFRKSSPAQNTVVTPQRERRTRFQNDSSSSSSEVFSSSNGNRTGRSYIVEEVDDDSGSTVGRNTIRNRCQYVNRLNIEYTNQASSFTMHSFS